MRKRYGIGALVASLVFLGGCIITSASPDPNQTVIMNPGEQKAFSVTSIGAPLISNGWYIDDTITSEMIGSVGAFTYAPTSVDVGRHRLTIKVIDFRIDGWGPGGMETTILWRGTREWDVVVNGVQITPFVNLVFPGDPQEFTATAYPEGAYTYTWCLDGTPSSTGENYTFTPSAAQYGTHTLTVKATGSGTDYESSIKIQVPFATVGSDLDDVPGHLVQTSDGGYVATGYSHDYYSTVVDIQVFKLASDGSLQWHTSLGGNGIDRDSGVIATTDGGYIVAGTSSSSDIPGAANHGGSDVYLVKLDAQGAVVWQSLYGGSEDDKAAGLIPTTEGGFVVTGMSRSQDIPDVPGHGNADFYVIKSNADGAVQWQNLYDVGLNDAASSIRQTADGGYIMTGSNEADLDDTFACLLKLNAAGTLQWSNTYESGVITSFADVREISGGGFLAAGYRVKKEDVGLSRIETRDALIVKYNAQGVLVWGKTYGGEEWDKISSLLPASDGNYVAFGTSFSFEIPGGHYDYGYVLTVDANGNALHQERIPMLTCPIPIVEGGYTALREVTPPPADDADISLVMLGPF